MAEDQELAEAEEAQREAVAGETSEQQLSAGSSTGPAEGSGSCLGTPYVKVTTPGGSEVPAATEDIKKRRPVNLVTSWGPKATKLKVTAAAAAASGGLTKPLRRSSPSVAPHLPPKSLEVKQQQVSTFWLKVTT